MLWFFDKGKRNTDRKDKILFIDARHIYRQVDRAHREFTPDQLEFIANIVRLYRNEPVDARNGSAEMLNDKFPDNKYSDVLGLCKVATIEEVRQQGYSLNPGRYVGVAEKQADEFEFSERLGELNEELEALNSEAQELEGRIAENISNLMEKSI
jgi:type I restriction enzyme M protein